MVQKEVADRLLASPGTKAYGSLTLYAQYYSTVEKLVDVPARCFRPKPKVDSTFIKMEIRPTFPLQGAEERQFFALIRAIFQSRRKMLSNSLKSLGIKAEQSLAALQKVEISPEIRGEKLSLHKLVELSKALCPNEVNP